MNNRLVKFFIIAGEPSGDLHGGKLIKALKKLELQISFIGHGGDSMKNEGMKIVKHINDLSIMGFFEIIKHLPRMIMIMNKTVKLIRKLQPDRIILIDYPGFNLRLAKKIANLKIPITYFILPQAWAWKESRVEILKAVCDQAISIFPFEQKWYQSKNYIVDYLGHPFMDRQHVQETTKSFYSRHNLEIDNPILVLLPGSRQQEVDRHWPIFDKTVKLLRIKIPNLQILIAKSPHVVLPKISNDYKIEIDSHKAIITATVALVASGTATLECAIEDIPMVNCYKLSPISWKIAKTLIKIKYSSMVNLIAGERIVPEILQNDMTPNKIVSALIPLFNKESEIRLKMLKEYSKIRESLGTPGFYNRAAELILTKTTIK